MKRNLLGCLTPIVLALGSTPGAHASVTSLPAASSAPHRPGADEIQEVAAVIQEAVDQVLLILKNSDLPRAEKRKRVIAIVEPLIDFELLAMLSLGKTHWTRIDPEQRDAFTQLFIATLKLSYYEKLELFTDEKVEFEKPTPIQTKGSPKYYVLTYIVSKGGRVKVAYEVASRDGEWRVFDIEIEGVSVRKSYGAQYTDFLREKSFDELLETMRTKLKESEKRESDSKDNQ